MGIVVDVAYRGSLRCEATHAPSGSGIETDAPTDNRGRGERFSPTDLLGAAVGSCMLTLMGIAAQRRGFDIEGASARVEKQMVSDPIRRVGRFEIVVEMPARYPDDQRELLERAAMTCPVFNSLDPRIEKQVEFRYPG